MSCTVYCERSAANVHTGRMIWLLTRSNLRGSQSEFQKSFDKLLFYSIALLLSEMTSKRADYNFGTSRDQSFRQFLARSLCLHLSLDYAA